MKHLLATLLFILPVHSHTNDFNIVVNGKCDVFSYNTRQRVKCVVIDLGDGGYVTNVNDNQVYINESIDKMYINGKECNVPSIKSNNAAVSSICMSTPDLYTVVMPIRSEFEGNANYY